MQLKQLGLLCATLVPFLLSVVAIPTPEPHAVGFFYLAAPGKSLPELRFVSFLLY